MAGEEAPRGRGFILHGQNIQSVKGDLFMTSEISRCPKCGSKELMRQERPNGQGEIFCLNLDCDFTAVEPAATSSSRPVDKPFDGDLDSKSPAELQQLADDLDQSAQALTGRSSRLARRQLAYVRSELKRRNHPSHQSAESVLVPDDGESESVAAGSAPPQFNTPQAAAKRVEGIRQYYRLRRLEARGEISGQGETCPGGPPRRWIEPLVKTLRDEAQRHEQAAQSYARVPNLATLHVEHAARAFEIHRLIDMLRNFTEHLSPKVQGRKST